MFGSLLLLITGYDEKVLTSRGLGSKRFDSQESGLWIIESSCGVSWEGQVVDELQMIFPIAKAFRGLSSRVLSRVTFFC